MATDAFDGQAAPVPVFRVRYRASAKNAPDLERMLDRFGALRWVEPDPEPSGDGAAPASEPALSEDEAAPESAR